MADSTHSGVKQKTLPHRFGRFGGWRLGRRDFIMAGMCGPGFRSAVGLRKPTDTGGRFSFSRCGMTSKT